MKKVVIKDIARLAEVSVTTVSKIINGKDRDISQATIDRVNRIMAENCYVPNKLAGSLVTKVTKTIGLIIPDITNPFFPELVRGAEDKANEAGYSIFFCNSDDDPEKEQRYIKGLTEKRVDGIIFTAVTADSGRTTAFKNISVPVILVDRVIELDEVKASIVVDNVKGAYDATHYLLKLGHRRILHLTGPKEGTSSQERECGYRKALEAFNIVPLEEDVQYGQFKLDWGYKAMEQVVASKKDYTAVFCGNDLIAMGVMRYLKDHDLKIPEDWSVIGFDDIQMASHVDPPLTTISQPKYQLGYQAVEVMIDLLSKGEESGPIRKQVLASELMIRKTCSKPKGE